jgi:hypothetical protein
MLLEPRGHMALVPFLIRFCSSAFAHPPVSDSTILLFLQMNQIRLKFVASSATMAICKAADGNFYHWGNKLAANLEKSFAAGDSRDDPVWTASSAWTIHKSGGVNAAGSTGAIATGGGVGGTEDGTAGSRRGQGQRKREAVDADPAFSFAMHDLVQKQRKNVTALACGNRHSIALTDEGEIYSWGFADQGQLGHGDEESLHAQTGLRYTDYFDGHANKYHARLDAPVKLAYFAGRSLASRLYRMSYMKL